MELLLNTTWLVISVALIALLLASRSRCVDKYKSTIHSRSTAWISLLVLIALLLPAISMTDDLMAMVTPTDGEQILRRYDSCAGSPQPAHLHLTILHVARNVCYSPLTVIGEIESAPALQMNCAPHPRYTQDRAPPATA
jgi:hypothetical protein